MCSCFVLLLGNALVGAQHHEELVVTSKTPRRDSTHLSHRSRAGICVLAICMRCFAVCLVFFSEFFYTLLGRHVRRPSRWWQCGLSHRQGELVAVSEERRACSPLYLVIALASRRGAGTRRRRPPIVAPEERVSVSKSIGSSLHQRAPRCRLRRAAHRQVVDRVPACSQLFWFATSALYFVYHETLKRSSSLRREVAVVSLCSSSRQATNRRIRKQFVVA